MNIIISDLCVYITYPTLPPRPPPVVRGDIINMIIFTITYPNTPLPHHTSIQYPRIPCHTTHMQYTIHNTPLMQYPLSPPINTLPP